jgi:isopenicillin N synthase-like dioxygenase
MSSSDRILSYGRSMIPYTPPKAAKSIPVVDVSATDEAGRLAAAQAIHRACRETGFFYVSGTGIAPELVAAQFDWSRRFFDLPLADKMSIDMKRSPAAAGYEPIGGQVLDSQDSSAEAAPPDLKESFYCARELPSDHPWALRRMKGFGHNQWPADMPGFRAQMLAYHDALRVVGNRLLSLLALSLDLPENWFESFYVDASSTLRLIKYPPHPAAAKLNQLGAGAHTDWGGVTILAQDQSGGLEVCTVEGDWIAAPPIPDTFVVNLGDLMARWTNGIYRSNLHRVRNNSGVNDRYSVPFFHSPNPDAKIAPMPSCLDEEHPRRFSDCTADEHMREMFRRSYGYAPGAA